MYLLLLLKFYSIIFIVLFVSFNGFRRLKLNVVDILFFCIIDFLLDIYVNCGKF